MEEALRLLWTHFPHNTESSHVLLKALVLDRLYSTQVNDIDVEPLARHIAGLSIDPLLDQGRTRSRRFHHQLSWPEEIPLVCREVL